MKIQPPITSMLRVEDDLLVALQDIANTMQKAMKTIAVVEDGFTGGLLTAVLASTCDASVLRRAWLVQDEQGKVEEVGVQRSTIERCAPASEAVGIEMALGSRRNAACTYGVSVCGDLLDHGKRRFSGSVWIVISHGKTFSISHHELEGERHEMARQAVTSSVVLLQEAIRYF